MQDGFFCCPRGCGGCGGFGCQNLGLGEANCCGSGIRKTGRLCSVIDAPCGLPGSGVSAQPTAAPVGTPKPTAAAVLTAAPTAAAAVTAKPTVAGVATSDPTCSNGVLNADRNVCCSKSKQGAPQRGNPLSRSRGAAACCQGNIRTANLSCALNPAPCVIVGGTAPPATAPPATTGPVVPPATTGPVVPPLGGVRQPTAIAILPGNPPALSLPAREALYGVKVESILMFQQINNLHFEWVADELNKGHLPQLVIEFFSDGVTCAKIAQGMYDPLLMGFINAAKAANDVRPFYIRPLHEFNGDWYPWGIYVANNVNSVADFKAAFRHVSLLFKANLPHVKVQQGYNNRNAFDTPTDMGSYFVGADVVDMVCFSLYNFAGIPNLKVAIPAAMPMCISEMSSTDIGINKPAWITDTWNALATQFTRITFISWFFEQNGKTQNGIPTRWDLNNQAEIDAWTSGLNNFRSVTAPLVRQRRGLAEIMALDGDAELIEVEDEASGGSLSCA
ncbi:glycoside hydrolase superfamily [Tribonema minus]|uniref:Glycoside hydrolase superfamily n=1 Tax=Tribonema minus TaxID=303371 RepID=A0A835ZAE6_9STRA|nr:glycoside hydrolase superfamily [Tribonema minus]